LDITSDGIFIKGDWLVAHLPLGVNLEHDLKAYANQFQSMNQITPINNGAVRMFINRARALADKNAAFNVTLRVENGQLILSHRSIASSTEEYFLAEGLPTDVNYTPVSLPADLLSLALQHVTILVYDYLQASQIVMRGVDPDFVYVIGGETKEN